MNWLNNVFSDLHKRLSKDDQNVSLENSGLHRIKEQKSEEKLHQFQSRLEDLDRRLLELR